MRPKLTLLVLLLALWAPAAHAQSRAEAKSFHFSSRGSGFGVEGEFFGTYRVSDTSIEVDVKEATVHVSRNCPYQGRRAINTMKFGLWNEARAKDRTAVESSTQPYPLNFILTPGEEYSLHDLHFSIPKERGIDLSSRWIVVLIQTDAIDSANYKPGSGFVMAFSCKDIFKEENGELAGTCSGGRRKSG